MSQNRFEISKLGPAIIRGAFELISVEILHLHQTRHGIGQLDFAARTGALVGQEAKDFRLQDVAAGNGQV